MIIFKKTFFKRDSGHGNVYLKKIEALSLKIFAMRRFKNEKWYFYAKSAFLSKARNNFNI